MHFLSPAILEFVANGRVQGPQGNRDPHMAPHGVYPCVADDSWIAIACATEEQWRTLSDLMGRPELARDSRFATLDARIVNQDPVGPRQLANTWRNSQFLWGVRDAFPQR
jgi:crotonobetainyl-CoA:carnitine CoA-transferase CaiB-like acyl-CoA transferase